MQCFLKEKAEALLKMLKHTISHVSDTRQFNVNVCVDGVKLQLRGTSDKEYIYRKAAKIVNNHISEVKT